MIDPGQREGTSAPRRLVLGNGSDAAAKARQVCRRFVRQLTPPVDDRTAEDVDLVVTELVTNAVRHARGATCVLSLDARPDAVEVTVLDSDPGPPRPRTPDFSGRFGGFGWPMIRRLARSVTVVLVPNGKAVCALVPR